MSTRSLIVTLLALAGATTLSLRLWHDAPPAGLPQAQPVIAPVQLSPEAFKEWKEKEQKRTAALGLQLTLALLDRDARLGDPFHPDDPRRITRLISGRTAAGGPAAEVRSTVIRDGLLIDDFGRPYWFHARASDSYDVVSLGPDGLLDTDDDVRASSPPGRAEMLLGVPLGAAADRMSR